MRTFDAAFVNRIFNDPEVLPYAMDDDRQESYDLTDFIKNYDNIVYGHNEGLFMVHSRGIGRYECHTCFRKEGRSKAYDAAVWSLRELFTTTDCETLFTRIPVWNRAARVLAESVGFTKVYTIPDKWKRDGKTYDVDHYQITFESWVANSQDCLDEGEWFHERLQSQIGYENHPDCSLHNRFAGACSLCIKAGAVDEGILKYNKWSSVNGYAILEVMNYLPLILDIGESGFHVLVKDNDLEVI